MFIDQNTMEYALVRHVEFRYEAEHERLISGLPKPLPAKGRTAALSMPQFPHLPMNLVLLDGRQNEMVRVRISISNH